MDELGVRLRARRAELGLTLAQVAHEAGLSVPYVANLEKGRGNPTLDVLVGLARALQVGLADLFSDARGVIDPALADLPPVLVEFAKGQMMAARVHRLAEVAGLNDEEMRNTLLRSMARFPRRGSGVFTLADCQRYLDMVQLLLDESVAATEIPLH
jgi:transcriptional regulator with XRE-family HTH domain